MLGFGVIHGVMPLLTISHPLPAFRAAGDFGFLSLGGIGIAAFPVLLAWLWPVWPVLSEGVLSGHCLLSLSHRPPIAVSGQRPLLLGLCQREVNGVIFQRSQHTLTVFIGWHCQQEESETADNFVQRSVSHFLARFRVVCIG